MQFVKGPDFPTGGVIYKLRGEEDMLRSAIAERTRQGHAAGESAYRGHGAGQIADYCQRAALSRPIKRR